MIEKRFDVPFIADLARREKQIQQSYRPIIGVHKWFARRPGTLFRGLLLSEFTNGELQAQFYSANDLTGHHIADPFMGGGIPVLEANRVGCDVTGFDINPMSYWIVKQEIEHLDLTAYAEVAAALRTELAHKVGPLYQTQCTCCGLEDAQVKYFLWVKVAPCHACGQEMDLFPGYLLAADARHPKNVFICPACGGLSESKDRHTPGHCTRCDTELRQPGPAKRNRCHCSACGAENRYPNADLGAPQHRLFALEYHCPRCKPTHTGRFFKKPDAHDLARLDEAEKMWSRIAPTHAHFIPDDIIPSGDETNRLHRWGYRRYQEMFNRRQLLSLALSAHFIQAIDNERVRNALATNFSDLLRYQNMLCRYDSRALKSLDIFSVHGFPVGLIQCESNFLGIQEPGRKLCVGSGGWANIIEKFKKAKSYCDHPFEVRYQGRSKRVIPIKGEWIGDRLEKNGDVASRVVNISCQDAAACQLPDDSLDAVLTDPPYFGNVQYAELMDFCYVWLKKLVGDQVTAFNACSTRTPNELTGNVNMGRDITHFTDGLSTVFQRMAKALKRGSPLAFTYHHNKIEAYYPLAVAILDSGMACTASLPCPAEMGASIHINGTGSSTLDTVFVCRQTGIMQRKWLTDSVDGVADIVKIDLAQLRAGHVKPTTGDIRCVTYGHLIRLAIWSLRPNWVSNLPVTARIQKIADWLDRFGGWKAVEPYIKEERGCTEVQESRTTYGADHADISF